jgi:hypothetical protein
MTSSTSLAPRGLDQSVLISSLDGPGRLSHSQPEVKPPQAIVGAVQSGVLRVVHPCAHDAPPAFAGALVAGPVDPVLLLLVPDVWDSALRRVAPVAPAGAVAPVLGARPADGPVGGGLCFGHAATLADP